MCDFFSLLPDELFICVIFPKLYLSEVMTFKQVAKRYNNLGIVYQKEYKEPIYTSYDCLQVYEDNLPNGVCCVDIDITNRVTSIRAYRVMKYLTIRFTDADTSIYSSTYYPNLYTLSESNVDYFDISNLRDLEGLNMYYIPTEHKIPALSTLTDLTMLKIHDTNINLDLSSLINLSVLHIVDCPNITSFPKNIKLSTCITEYRYILTTWDIDECERYYKDYDDDDF